MSAMETRDAFSSLRDLAASRSKAEKFRCAMLGYPMLTIVTPLVTLLVLYVLFDCLDEEMCFKTDPVKPR